MTMNFYNLVRTCDKMEPPMLSQLFFVEFWFCVLDIQHNFVENDLLQRGQQDQRVGGIDRKFQANYATSNCMYLV
jgi:hypothetical protein